VGPVAMEVGNSTHIIIQFYNRANQMYQLNEGQRYKTLLVENFKTNIILFTRLTYYFSISRLYLYKHFLIIVVYEFSVTVYNF